MMATAVQEHLISAAAFAESILKSLETQLPWFKHNSSKIPMDHLCLRVETQAEYESYKHQFTSLNASLLTESIVGGRPIATFKLKDSDAIVVRDQSWPGMAGFGQSEGERRVTVIELPAPKHGSEYKTGWEHCEFALGHILPQPENLPPPSDMTEEMRNTIAKAVLQEFANDSLNIGVAFDSTSWKKGGFNIDLRIDPNDEFSVKFHWLALEHVIEIEKLKN